MVCAYVCARACTTPIPLCELLHSAEADVFISRGSAAGSNRQTHSKGVGGVQKRAY